ncbi:MAG: CP2 transcription factor-domain-containing protein [Benjaminiella poitrasii]|nr:MAG: CP2 transcription factor-domain-containing protein [Benjaminiella poitrasii]
MLSSNNSNNNNGSSNHIHHQSHSYYHQGLTSLPSVQQAYHHHIYRCYYHSPTSLTNSPPQLLNQYYPPIMDTFHHQLHQPIMSSSPPSQSVTTCLTSSSSSNINHTHQSSLTTNMIRYDIALEAPTAASQKIDEPPLTYLNKGQYYTITLKDKDRYDGDIFSTVSITFHDESHRNNAADYWKFWLTQQKDTEDAKAIELDLTRSNGAQAIETSRHFDCVSFKWNGKLGSSVQIRFNCLSTDFSRIKGVKGIPLRLQIESEQQSPQSTTNTTTITTTNLPHIIRPPSQHIEKTYCRIKLFRDKGAERKNKDDAKHIERQLEKLRGKSGEPHPLWLAYTPTSPITLFRELVPPGEFESHPLLLVDHHRLMPASSTHANTTTTTANTTNGLLLPLPTSMKRSFHGELLGTNNSSSGSSNSSSSNSSSGNNTPLGIDPTYIPQRRRRIAKLSILVKFPSSDVYRAIYLEHLTVHELIEKLVQRMDEAKKPVANVLRKITTKDQKSLIVKMDDEVIQDMNEEQDIQVEVQENPEDSNTINLILNF